jgi:hypothetical protein
VFVDDCEKICSKDMTGIDRSGTGSVLTFLFEYFWQIKQMQRAWIMIKQAAMKMPSPMSIR